MNLVDRLDITDEDQDRICLTIVFKNNETEHVVAKSFVRHDGFLTVVIGETTANLNLDLIAAFFATGVPSE